MERLLCSAGLLAVGGEAEGDSLLRPRWGMTDAAGGPAAAGAPGPPGPAPLWVLRLVSARVLNSRFLLVGILESLGSLGSPPSPWAARSHWYESGDELSSCGKR